MSYPGLPPKPSPETCRLVEAKINYKFNSQSLLVEALYAAQQLAMIGERLIEEANNQLARVGHAAMVLAIVDRAYAAEKSTGTLRGLVDISETLLSPHLFSTTGATIVARPLPTPESRGRVF